MTLTNKVCFDVIFGHTVDRKIKFFQHILTRLTTRTFCFLRLKLSIFIFYLKIEDQTNDKNNTSKIVKNGSVNLKNRVPVEAKWWVVKNEFFLSKKHLDFGAMLQGTLGCPNPISYNEFV